MEEKKNSGLDFSFSLMMHNFLAVTKRLIWPFIVLAIIVGIVSYRRADRNYVPMYTSSVVFSVTARFSTTTDLDSTSSYLDSNAAEVLTTTFHYVINSENALYLLRAQLDVSVINATLTATSTADSALFTMQATGTDPAEVYTILMAAVDIYPQAAASILGDTRLVILNEPLGPSTKPINPNNAKNVGVTAGVVALVVGIGILFLLSLTRKTLHSAEDIRRLVNLPCLSYVPIVKLKKRTDQSHDNIAITNPRINPSFNESIRNLRVKVKRLLEKHNAQILLVTSTIPNEGKTTIATNLALSLASEGKRVILIDADMRKQSLKGALGLTEPSEGLVEILTGSLNNFAPISVPGTSLLLLSGDRTIDQPQALLDSTRMKQLLALLRQKLDYIIIDSPPAGVMSDAATIAKHVDASLYIVRQDTASTSEILNSIETIAASGGNLIGCVLNRTQVGTTRYGYGSKYTSGYSYSYGNKYYSYSNYRQRYSRYAEEEEGAPSEEATDKE